jgi:hypothetical protein
VNPVDPNLVLLELIAAALGPLRERFVFIGGCTTGMLVTDVAAAPVRATRDVVLFLATKLEAFRGRGGGDLLASHDLEDIITVIDGRHELLDDVRASASQLRSYIAHEIGVLLQNSEFNQALPGHLAGDETSQARVPLIKGRLRQLSLVA